MTSSPVELRFTTKAEAVYDEIRSRIVQAPPGLARLVRLAGAAGVSFVLLEQIIQAHLSQLFPGQEILQAAVIRLARDAELEFDDEGGRTQLELVERELRRRRRRGAGLPGRHPSHRVWRRGPGAHPGTAGRAGLRGAA